MMFSGHRALGGQIVETGTMCGLCGWNFEARPATTTGDWKTQANAAQHSGPPLFRLLTHLHNHNNNNNEPRPTSSPLPSERGTTSHHAIDDRSATSSSINHSVQSRALHASSLVKQQQQQQHCPALPPSHHLETPANMSGPQIYMRWPSFTLSALNPDPLPAALPPPIRERSFRSPFGIDKDLFNFALKPQVPISFASAYIVSVLLLNAYNRKRNNKPWAVSRQKWFKPFVIIHNALLTIYSTATFLAMCRAFAHTWPGLSNEYGLAGAADALCKIHGPRGLGDAATFNSTINIWEVKNTAIRLSYDGNPDPTDYGRLWNEGLAFWGWIFYVSKFYEVVDTLIILAKGKRSATLQTYHHAGAMLCMWAGIRYMSPPIWMFVFVNSFIHALMYTYFTLTALGYKVPASIKRSLTSLQITQFVWGASYAAIHLFVQYDIPISTPYQVAHTISAIASSATSKAQSATSAVSEAIATPSAVAWGALGKKLLLRALGEEGLAEKVHNKQHQPLNAVMEEKIEQFKEQVPGTPKYETRWRTEWTRTDCLDTTGEAFAVYLNLFYLAPLTFLFARFFYKAYLKRGKSRSAAQGAR